MSKKMDIRTASALQCVWVFGLRPKVPQSGGCSRTSEMPSPVVRRPEAQSPGVPGLPPSEAPGEDPSCLFQLLGAPGVLGLRPHPSTLCF